jgi:hypothetical protein
MRLLRPMIVFALVTLILAACGGGSNRTETTAATDISGEDSGSDEGVTTVAVEDTGGDAGTDQVGPVAPTRSVTTSTAPTRRAGSIPSYPP